MNYSWGTMPTDHNYTGQRGDNQSGLLYYNFRWYDPTVSRFVRTDDIQNNRTGNDPYAYVNGNPETLGDPTGHDGEGDPQYTYYEAAVTLWYMEVEESYNPKTSVVAQARINGAKVPALPAHPTMQDIKNLSKALQQAAKQGGTSSYGVADISA